MADLLPASFLIDWVRVYQDPEDSTQVRRYLSLCRYFSALFLWVQDVLILLNIERC
jgi:hypothetical protein